MDVIDRIRSLLKLPFAIYTILRSLYQDYATLLARARAPPGLPVPEPSSAFWQDHPPFPDLVNIHSPAGPPHTADVVIIGSGITALAIARSYLRELDRKGELANGDSDVDSGDSEHGTTAGGDKERKRGGRKPWVRVLVLEARELCSGATGRNGGHIKASPHELFHRLTTSSPSTKATMDPSRAAQLCAFQISHVQLLKEVVQAEDIETVSEFREVQTIDLAVDEDTDSKIKAQVAAFVPHCPQPPSHGSGEYVMRTHSGDEARRLFGVNERVVGAIEYPAGALWPYRFVTALWDKLLAQFSSATLMIETGTAVESVTTRMDDDDDGHMGLPYVVSTSRGQQIRARHVVHATNGFASQLLPELAGKAAGVLCHMTAQRPGQKFPQTNGQRSYSIIYGSGFDYITQRPSRPAFAGAGEAEVTEEQEGGEGNELMIGGGLFQSGKQGMDMFGLYDDRKLDAMTLMHLEGCMSTVFDWGGENAAGKRRVIKAWSGVVGFSGDVLPLVGRLDPRLTKRAVTRSSRRCKGSVPSEKKHTRRSADIEAGEWIAAYFCGDGMVWAWGCGTALGIMLAGSEYEDLPKEPGRPAGRLEEWFPAELRPSWGRVQRMDISDLADEL